MVIKDPGNVLESVGQGMFDTADEKGIAYSAGYVTMDVVIAILTDKGLDKLKSTGKAGKTTANVADDIQGLSASEIAEKYALPQVPDKIVYLQMPSDISLEVSIVGPQESWGTLGGDAQYAIKDILLDDDWFTDIHDLK